METILDRILDTKRREVAEAMARVPLSEMQARASSAEPPRDFFTAVAGECGFPTDGTGVISNLKSQIPPIRLIAEIKKASPSAGIIRADFDPVAIAQTYHRHGAAALSVLTDETYFQGRLEYIRQVKEAVPLPVLRKDFIIGEYQLHESRAAGADAVLWIAEVLGVETMAPWLPICRELGLFVLIEVHGEKDLHALLERVGPPGPGKYLLGINNRDLTTQRTDLSTTARLARLLPGNVPFVSESGISTHEDVAAVQQAGACAILVGESLLRSPNIGMKIASLFP